MNCKPGDLVIVVGADDYPEHLGLILTVLRYEESDHPEFCGVFGWATEPPVVDPEDGDTFIFADEHLRPIRDPGDDETDEMLLIVGRPNERVPA